MLSNPALLGLLLFVTPLALAQEFPPAFGEWRPSNTSYNCADWDGTLTVSGPVLIQSNLSISNCEITIAGSTTPFNHTWLVAPVDSIALSISDSTIAPAPDSAGAWALSAQSRLGGSVTILDSRLDFGATQHGASIHAQTVTFRNSDFFSSPRQVAAEAWTVLIAPSNPASLTANINDAPDNGTVLVEQCEFTNSNLPEYDDAQDDDNDNEVHRRHWPSYLAGTLRIIGRSSVSLSDVNAQELVSVARFLDSDAPDNLAGTLVMSASDVESSTVYRLEVIEVNQAAIDTVTVTGSCSLQRRAATLRDTPIAGNINVTLSGMTFSPEDCAELLVDPGVEGRIQFSQLANPLVAGIQHWAKEHRESPSTDGEWEYQDNCLRLGNEEFFLCDIVYDGHTCNNQWIWIGLLSIVASLCCGGCLLCILVAAVFKAVFPQGIAGLLEPRSRNQQASYPLGASAPPLAAVPGGLPSHSSFSAPPPARRSFSPFSTTPPQYPVNLAASAPPPPR